MHSGLLAPLPVDSICICHKGEPHLLSNGSFQSVLILQSLLRGRVEGAPSIILGCSMEDGAMQRRGSSHHCLTAYSGQRRTGAKTDPRTILHLLCTQSQPALNQAIGMCRLISSSVWHTQQTDQLWHLYSWANLARRCVSRCSGASNPSAAILLCLLI